MDEGKDFETLLEKIYRDRKVDLREYRPSCLMRRIQACLRARKVSTYAEYIDVLDKDPSEYINLFNSAFINVTEFFRDPKAFKAFRDKALAEIINLKEAEGKRIIRIWSAGCATGEEAYTFAIILHELLGERINNFRVTVYGTDIDKEALEKACNGEYSAYALKHVEPNLLNKYFTPRDGGSRGMAVKDNLRAITKFQHYDLIANKPLAHVDLISCRNVVIYFSKELQSKIYAKFYQGLNSKGFLILGKVEALFGEVTRYFEAVDVRERIYRKKV